MRYIGLSIFLAGLAHPAVGQSNTSLPGIVTEAGKPVAITHVIVVDGTGAAVRPDQTVIVKGSRIIASGPAGHIKIPKIAQVIDGRGKSLIPGLVGMHEHMFYASPIAGPPIPIEQFVTAPRLYLASGVTTARTAGSMDPYGDLELKRGIDAGKMIGPDLTLSTPYLEGAVPAVPTMHALSGPDDARRLVRYWYDQGFRSVKAYADVSADELAAGINEAHSLGLTVTGHLCSVGYKNAMSLGIDNFEHGPFVSPDGDLDRERKPDLCRRLDGPQTGRAVLGHITTNVSPNDAEVSDLIQQMVRQHVALTSTLAVLEGGTDMSEKRRARLQALLHPAVWTYLNEASPERAARGALFLQAMRKEMAFERAFVKAGGLLMAGCDPTGDGFTLAGLGDQRNVELLVGAGFSVPDTIRIATLNGAKFDGKSDEIGSIEVGKRADLVLLNGDISRDVTAIEAPAIVFKAGVGFDSATLYKSVTGQAGLH
ncbi:amidohydrolase family protein [Sphingomonas sp. PAMC 26605]|uniref:amidohydrolase family protein n=1 Tax=Sphingomonas sp. PAMC 26605 TaxID=1112214 RepID=UPI00026CB5BF|nr:amidohydrolase family protein [Sphingomonas sp. PAMC 26605]